VRDHNRLFQPNKKEEDSESEEDLESSIGDDSESDEEDLEPEEALEPEKEEVFEPRIISNETLLELKSIYQKFKAGEINDKDANSLARPIIEKLFVLAETLTSHEFYCFKTYNTQIRSEIVKYREFEKIDEQEGKFILDEVNKLWKEQEKVREGKFAMVRENEKKFKEEKLKVDEEKKSERYKLINIKEANEKEDILRLEKELKKVTSHTDVIISIGNAHGLKDGKNIVEWDQNIMYKSDGSRQRLVINIDPNFSAYSETDDIKYFSIPFNEALLKRFENILTEHILENPTNQLILCEHRSPVEHDDVYHFLKKHIDHYKESGTDAGNLIFLAGYFAAQPLFWPTKNSILDHERERLGDYSAILKSVLKKTEGDYKSAFEEHSVLLYPQQGALFHYPSIGTISNVEQFVKLNQSAVIQQNSPRMK